MPPEHLWGRNHLHSGKGYTPLRGHLPLPARSFGTPDKESDMPNRFSGLELEKTIKNYIQCTSNVHISYLLTIISCESNPCVQQSSRLPIRGFRASTAVGGQRKSRNSPASKGTSEGEWMEHWEATGCSENHLMLKIIVWNAPLFWRELFLQFFFCHLIFCAKRFPSSYLVKKCQNTLSRGRNPPTRFGVHSLLFLCSIQNFVTRCPSKIPSPKSKIQDPQNPKSKIPKIQNPKSPKSKIQNPQIPKSKLCT